MYFAVTKKSRILMLKVHFAAQANLHALNLIKQLNQSLPSANFDFRTLSVMGKVTEKKNIVVIGPPIHQQSLRPATESLRQGAGS